VGTYTGDILPSLGTLASNVGYGFSFVGGTMTVNPASLTVTASNANKTYGQTASLTNFTTSGLLFSDSVTGVSLASTGAINTAGVGSYAITASGATGTGLGNYTISYANGSLAVNPASLTVTASNANKTFGQTKTFTGTEFTTSGLLFSDTVTGVTLASPGAINTANVGTYAITASGAVGTGLANYNINYVNGTLTVNPASLTVLTITANNATKVYGQTLTFTGTEFTTVGLLFGDSVTSVSLASAGAVNTANVGNYAITASGAVGTGLSNYSISYVNGLLTVIPRDVSVYISNLDINLGSSEADLLALSLEILLDGLADFDTADSVLPDVLANLQAEALATGRRFPLLSAPPLTVGEYRMFINSVVGNYNFRVPQNLPEAYKGILNIIPGSITSSNGGIVNAIDLEWPRLPTSSNGQPRQNDGGNLRGSDSNTVKTSGKIGVKITKGKPPSPPPPATGGTKS
jgi:hypothetical protein